MSHSFTKVSLIILFIAVFARLLGMFDYPLHDPTEARYAEIPRLIIETGNWIMPPFDYGVPFWGKPPLTFWMTAVSFEIFGYSEFAARLPVFLLALAVLWLIYRFAKFLQGQDKAIFSTLVLTSTALFFIASGAVMTDMALCFCISLSMISFWQALHNPISAQAKKWSYWFFVGLGLGLLVKGPVVGVLVLLPLMAWTILETQYLAVWQRIPWFKGTAVMLLIAVPWYIAAEINSPGFINYFLVGEHFKRFVDAGWHGDLYGVAHKHPRGKIWLLWLFASFPWSFIFLANLITWPFRKNKQQKLTEVSQSSWHRYLLFWAIAPMVFFSLSGNILYTYVLPGLPAFAILVTELLSLRCSIAIMQRSKWILATAFIPVLGLVFLGILCGAPDTFKFEKNQKPLVEIYQQSRSSDNSRLAYVGRRIYSVDFHTQGKAKRMHAKHLTLAWLQSNTVEDYMIVPKSKFLSLPKDTQQACDIIKTYRNYILLKERLIYE
jgi:4-amino-4-deoxy-L-arabinose transferase-like glycosyltransferase